VLQIGRSLVRSQLVSVDFSLTCNPSCRTMCLGSTQPLTGAFPGGKDGRCVRLRTYHHPVLLSRNLGNLTSWKPRPSQACNKTALPLPLHVSSNTLLIIRRSNFINTTSGTVFCASDRPVCRLRCPGSFSTRTPDGHLLKILYQMLY